MKRPWLLEACEAIDAAVFSGDVMYDPDARAALKKYVERWSRAITDAEKSVDEDGETQL